MYITTALPVHHFRKIHDKFNNKYGLEFLSDYFGKFIKMKYVFTNQLLYFTWLLDFIDISLIDWKHKSLWKRKVILSGYDKQFNRVWKKYFHRKVSYWTIAPMNEKSTGMHNINTKWIKHEKQKIHNECTKNCLTIFKHAHKSNYIDKLQRKLVATNILNIN